MLRLAVNYSHQAVELLQAGEIAPDLFKLPDWPDLVAQVQADYSVYIHFPFFVGREGAETIPWPQVKDLMAHTNTRYVNVHLAPHINTFAGLDLTAINRQSWQRVAARMIYDLETLYLPHFRADQIILENVPWDPSPQYAIPAAALIPDAVHKVIEATGCGFLLDTAHASLAARHLQTDPFGYLDQLPGEQMRELHITGTQHEEGKGWTDHHPMTGSDWELAEWVFERIRQRRWPAPEIVALEYGGVGAIFKTRSQHDVIQRELTRLAELIHEAQTALAQSPKS